MFYEDKVLKCKECGADFVFTAGEQSFYAEKGLVNEPSRCRDCRQRRKEERRGTGRQLYEAFCSSCGAQTQVPFKPTGRKPVYCRECMAQNSRYSYR